MNAELEPDVVLGPYTFSDDSSRVGAEVAAAVASSPEPLAYLRVRLTNTETGQTVPMPRMCLSCGFCEAPGWDFDAHICEMWAMVPSAVTAVNERAYWIECKRLYVECGAMSAEEAEEAFEEETR